MSRRSVASVLVLALFATPALALGPVLTHGGSPEAAIGVPSVFMVGGFPILIPQTLVDLAKWLRSAVDDLVKPEPKEPPATTKLGPALIHGG